MKAQFLISKRFLKSKSSDRRSTSMIVSVIAILGVTLGVMVPIVVLSVMEGFQNEIKSKILGVKGHGLIARENSQYIGQYQQLVQEVKQYSQITSAVPYIEVQGMAQLHSKYRPVSIWGVPKNFFEEDQELNQIFKLIDGKKDLSRRYHIMIGEEMAIRNNISVGDRISLLVAEEDSLDINTRPKIVKTKLVGTFKTGFQEFDNNFIYISLSTLQKVFDKPGKVKLIRFKVDDIWDMGHLFNKLINQYGSQFIFFSWKRLNYSFFKALALEKVLMYLIVSLILVVAIFNVTSSQLIIVIERKKEIGILKTIGMKPIHIAQIFLLQGFYISLIGSILGGILGFIISWDVAASISVIEHLINVFYFFFHHFTSLFVSQGSFRPIEIFPQGIYYLEGIPSDISFTRIVVFMGLSMLLSFLAGLLPSLKAASMKPIEVMRYE